MAYSSDNRKDRYKCDIMNADIIACRGGKANVPELLNRCGWLYGTRHDYKPHAQPYMLDINWERYDWSDYIAKVRAWKPTLAMVPDYFASTPKSLLLEQIAEVQEAGAIRVMVCPKFSGAAEDIPDDLLIAVSVPTAYAGFLPAPSELRGRRLHLLGGHPDAQAAITTKRYTESEVVSVDGNVMFHKAALGSYWSVDTGNWFDVRNQGFPTDDLIALSGNNIRRYLKSPPTLFSPRARILKCFPEGQCKVCQRTLADRRKGALTCSNSCRKALSRLNPIRYPLFYLPTPT